MLGLILPSPAEGLACSGVSAVRLPLSLSVIPCAGMEPLTRLREESQEAALSYLLEDLLRCAVSGPESSTTPAVSGSMPVATL